MGSFLPVLWPMRMPTLLLWQTERMSHPNAGRTFFPSLATRTVSPPPLVAQVPREGGRQQLTCPLTVDRWLLWNSPAGLVENPSVRPEGESPILAPMHRGMCVCVCVCVWVSEWVWVRPGWAVVSEQLFPKKSSQTISRPSLWERHSRQFFWCLAVAHFPGGTGGCRTVMSDIAGVWC